MTRTLIRGTTRHSTGTHGISGPGDTTGHGTTALGTGGTGGTTVGTGDGLHRSTIRGTGEAGMIRGTGDRITTGDGTDILSTTITVRST